MGSWLKIGLVVLFWPAIAFWTMWSTSSRALDNLAFGGFIFWVLMSALHLVAKVLLYLDIGQIAPSYTLCHIVSGIAWYLWMTSVAVTIPDDETH